MILPGREHVGREQSFTNPLPSALLPEKLHHLMKKKVFEAAFPLHEVRASTRVPGRRPWGNRGCISTSLDEGQDRAAGSGRGAGLAIKAALIFLYPTHLSALQKEEVREFLKERWARWRDIFCQQPIEKIR